MKDALTSRGLTTTKFKQKYPRLYSKILTAYGGKENIFDFCAAFTLYVAGSSCPCCDICGERVSITKKFRNDAVGKVRCSKHTNTNNVIQLSDVVSPHGYRVVSSPTKQLTRSDSIVVACEAHGEYTVSVGNFIGGMLCQKCYHAGMVGRAGITHTAETRNKISKAKRGKKVRLTDETRALRTMKQKEAWASRRENSEEFTKYLTALSNRRTEYIKTHGAQRPKKSNTGLEREFAQFLCTNGVAYEMQYFLDGKYFDFFIPEIGLVVEVDGEYWHRMPVSMANDVKKHIICKEHGLELLRISSDNFIPEIIFAEPAVRQEHTSNILRERGISGY